MSRSILLRFCPFLCVLLLPAMPSMPGNHSSSSSSDVEEAIAAHSCGTDSDADADNCLGERDFYPLSVAGPLLALRNLSPNPLQNQNSWWLVSMSSLASTYKTTDSRSLPFLGVGHIITPVIG